MNEQGFVVSGVEFTINTYSKDEVFVLDLTFKGKNKGKFYSFGSDEHDKPINIEAICEIINRAVSRGELK